MGIDWMRRSSFGATEVLVKKGELLPLEILAEHHVDITHHFAGGGYTKVFLVPAGKVIGQHRHKINHDGVLLLGEADVVMDGRRITLRAPATVTLIAHKAHTIEARSEILWACVWPDVKGLTDPEQIDHEVIAW